MRHGGEPQDQRRVHQRTDGLSAVETDEYATTGEIIHEALRQWQWNREFSPQESVRLRELGERSKASGPLERVDFAQLRKEALERMKQKQSVARAG